MSGGALHFLNAPNLNAVLDIPSPSGVDYASLDIAYVADGVEAIKDAWIPILRRDKSFCETPLEDSDSRWREASLRLAYHFVAALPFAEPCFAKGRGGRWTPFLKSFQRDIYMEDSGADTSLERHMISYFCSAYWGALFTEVVGSAVVGLTENGWDLFIFWDMQNISQIATTSPHKEHLKIGHVFVEAIARRAKDAVEKRDARDRYLRDKLWGPLVNTREIGKLARRDESVVTRYGDKAVEERFEQQLSVLFQSFGFIVASTSRGERRVDLICIATQAGAMPFTVLVEAKSTARAYSLPTKDARALQEYVETVKYKLNTFPPLKLVLIVGPEPARTLDSKLRTLESQVSVPFRYCRAEFLSNLRSAFAGALPSGVFLEAACRDSQVLTNDTFRAVVEHMRGNAEAHNEFVRRMIQ